MEFFGLRLSSRALARVDFNAVLGVGPVPFFPAGSFFDVFFDVFVEGVGIVQHQAHFAIEAGQPLEFSNISVGAPESPAFAVHFELNKGQGAVVTSV